MKKFLIALLLLGAIVSVPLVSDAARATGPMTLTGFLCAKASEGTSCLGDYPAAGGAWDGPTDAVALEPNDTALVFTSSGLAIYKYTTDATSDDTINTIARTVAASSGGWVLVPLAADGIVGARVAGQVSSTCLYEVPVNGDNYICIKPPTAITANVDVTLQDAAGTVVYRDSSDTLTNKTLDVDGTGNVLKQWVYIPILGSAFKKLGSSITAPATTVTASNYGLPKFSNSADKANNFVDFIIPVPPDIDTAVDLTATLQFMLGGADTGDFEYILSMVSIAASGAVAGTPGNAVSFAYTADASGADGDYEVTAELTLTNWRSNVTAGNLWLIRLERDGDHANDSSTVDSYPLVLTIKYKSTQ